MSSGEKVVVYNTRERVLSTDANRAQAFSAQLRSQLARGQFNNKRENWYDRSGVASLNVGGETPLAAEVFSGLMVDPQTSFLLVTPGQMGCLFPDPSISADDSPYMLIDDPGLQIAGILTFTANGGGGPRVDLVECRPALVIIESDNRDIFNPATGLFSPAPVTKVQAFQLQYRIRLGASGGGVPALAATWLPLAAIVTGTAAASFADCDFYDVRPLVEDRVLPQPASAANAYAGNHPIQAIEFSTSVVSGATCIGGYAVSDFNGYLAGGALRRSTPYFSGGSRTGTGAGDGDADFINLSNVENQDTTFAYGVHYFFGLVAIFPGFLPRWVRYSESVVSPFGRIPQGPRGIIVASSSSALANGSYSLVTTSTFINAPGVRLAALNCDNAGTGIAPSTTEERWTHTSDPPYTFDSTVVGSSVICHLFIGQDYPATARKLRVTATVNFTSGSAGADQSCDITALDSADVEYAKIGTVTFFAYDVFAKNLNFTFEVPIKGRLTFDDTTGQSSLKIKFALGGPITPNSIRCETIAWKL